MYFKHTVAPFFLYRTYTSSLTAQKAYFSQLPSSVRRDGSINQLLPTYSAREDLIRCSYNLDQANSQEIPYLGTADIAHIGNAKAQLNTLLPLSSLFGSIGQSIEAKKFHQIGASNADSLIPVRRSRLRRLARLTSPLQSAKKATEWKAQNNDFSQFFSATKKRALGSIWQRSTTQNRFYRKIAPLPLLLSQTNGQKSEQVARFNSTWGDGLGNVTTHSSLTDTLSLLAGTSVHLTILPALSLARYAFDFEAIRLAAVSSVSNASITSRDTQTAASAPLNSARFIRHLEQEISGRFQYVAVQIPDLLRLSFVCIYFKKASVLAHIFALTLAALPRNRKETQFLRFLIKVVKIFAAQRTERLGVRLRFKGRVNRWRRTKHLIGEKGILPLYTYSARIEIGEAQAITRKGALGIRLWLAYHPSFARTFRRTLLAFSHANKNTLILFLLLQNTFHTF